MIYKFLQFGRIFKKIFEIHVLKKTLHAKPKFRRAAKNFLQTQGNVRYNISSYDFTTFHPATHQITVFSQSQSQPLSKTENELRLRRKSQQILRC